jgi:hypothetical protein
MRKVISFVVLISFIFLLSSCATIFKGDFDNIQTSSEPIGAKVYVNDTFYGNTPLRLKLKSKGEYKIEFKMEGYKPITRIVTNHIGVGWVILDILGGLLPVVVEKINNGVRSCITTLLQCKT